MKKIQQGFTLIELMIVVAIIGILAAVAIPQYQDYITRAKLAKVAPAVDPLKTAFAEYVQNNGLLTAASADMASTLLNGGAFTATAEVSTATVNVTLNAIVATLRGINSTIDGTTVTWTASSPAGGTALTWTPTCGGTAPNNAIVKKVFGC